LASPPSRRPIAGRLLACLSTISVAGTTARKRGAIAWCSLFGWEMPPPVTSSFYRDGAEENMSELETVADGGK
jgi:hypothetical protein